MPNTRVHRVLEQFGSIVFPGVYDTLSARIVQRVGFPMSFISGYSVAAAGIGEPDLGLLTQTEIVERARRVCGAVKIPIIVDAATGDGNPLTVIRTVRELISAVEAKAGRDFFIVARTDALAAVSLDEAIARVTEAREAGADASFVEAPESKEQMAEIGKRAPRPIVANMIEHGRTPVLPKEELVRLGFQLILYPLAGIFAAAKALEEVYQKLKRDQTTAGMENRLMAFKEFNDLIGVEEKYRTAERFGVK